MTVLQILRKQYSALATPEERAEFRYEIMSPLLYRVALLEAQSIPSLDRLLQSLNSLLKTAESEWDIQDLLSLKKDTITIKKRLEDNAKIDYKTLTKNLIFPCGIRRDEVGFFIFEYPPYLDQTIRKILKDKIYRDHIVRKWACDEMHVLLQKPPFSGSETDMAQQINNAIIADHIKLLSSMRNYINIKIIEFQRTINLLTKEGKNVDLAELKLQGESLLKKVSLLTESSDPMTKDNLSSLMTNINRWVKLTTRVELKHRYNVDDKLKVDVVEDFYPNEEKEQKTSAASLMFFEEGKEQGEIASTEANNQDKDITNPSKRQKTS